MNEDFDFEKSELKREIRKLKEINRQNSQTMRYLIFFAVWLLPIYGMEMVDYEPGPVEGPINSWTIWFLGVPICFWLYYYFNKHVNE